MKTTQQVAAALIIREEKLLIGKRTDSPVWEFPGGKLELGESPKEALCRECIEELGVSVVLKQFIWETEYEYPQKRVHLSFFTASITQGNPKPNVHKELKWVSLNDIKQYTFWPANDKLIENISKGIITLT